MPSPKHWVLIRGLVLGLLFLPVEAALIETGEAEVFDAAALQAYTDVGVTAQARTVADLVMALAAYNGGASKVRKAMRLNGGRVPSFMRGYERRIARNYEQLVSAAGIDIAAAPLPFGPRLVRDAI